MGKWNKQYLRPLFRRLRYGAGRLGYLVRGSWSGSGAIPPGSKVYVGCGEDRREGYYGCDVRPLRSVALVSKAWKLSRHCSELSEIYTRHMLEHLTFDEATAALHDWHEALAVGGRLHLVVPNLDFHIQQWLRAEWSEEALSDKRSDARWGFAGLYGWQRECNPRQAPYHDNYWDVHKSGYNPRLLSFLLERAGFSDVEIHVEDDCHLVAGAIKQVAKGERQVAPDVGQIRIDHRKRYEFAADLTSGGARVLDVACGVGYGSRILSDRSPAAEIVATDVDRGAIAYARRHYPSPNVRFEVGDAGRVDWPSAHFDMAVSFETIEHLPDAPGFLARVFQAVRPGGTLVCSVPNQDRMPFDPKRHKYHLRHYTPGELEQLLAGAGFELQSRHSQPDSESDRIDEGWQGQYIIAVCRRPKAA